MEMSDHEALQHLLKLKKKQVLIFRQNDLKDYPPSTGSHKLKVLYKAKLSGDVPLVRCKVLGNDDWYKEIYITQLDFRDGRIISTK